MPDMAGLRGAACFLAVAIFAGLAAQPALQPSAAAAPAVTRYARRPHATYGPQGKPSHGGKGHRTSSELPRARPEGYLVASANGDVFAFGDASEAGGTAPRPLEAQIVGIAPSPAGSGYWLAGANGTVFASGGARFYGRAGGRPSQRIVGIAAAAAGRGYWLASATGQVMAFGDARKFKAPDRSHVPGEVVGIASTPDGLGYWLVTATGSVLAFGDAQHFGSAARLEGTAVAGIAAAPDGRGYWLVGQDGRVFAYGDARYWGSHLHTRVVGIAATPDGKGYWLATAKGGVLAFGDARPLGSLVTLHLHFPIAAIVTSSGPPRTGPEGLRIVTPVLPTARVGQPYDFRLIAAGGVPPYKWLIEHGALPGGLSFDTATGVISGIPLVPTVADLTFAVLDSKGARASTILTLDIGQASGPVKEGEGALAITVDQLPAGLVGSVAVSGPDGYAEQVSSTTVLKVVPGIYTVTAQAVSDGTNTYYPAVTGSPAQVAAGREAVVGVSYLITIPHTTRVLGPSDLAHLSSASPNGSTLTFTWSGEEPPDLAAIQQGDVLDAPASTHLPLGLFVKVTSMATQNGALYITTKPATLTEAVTQGEFEVSGHTEHLSVAQMRALGAKVQPFLRNGPSTTCGLDLNGQLNLANPTFTITPHMDASWSLGGGFQADAYLTVVESVQYSFKFSAGLDCTETWKLVGPFNLLGTVGIPIDLGIVDINISPVFEVDLTAKAEVNA